MKRFIVQLIYFTIPFLILIIIASKYYTKSGGDLNRIGKVPIKQDYRRIFNNGFNQEIKYLNLSDLDLGLDNKIDVLTIGDSYSNQKKYGYQNYLASSYHFSILNFNEEAFDFEDYNPLQYLFKITNGNIFSKLKVKYVVLQVVERDFIKYHQKVDTSLVLTIEEINSKRRVSTVNKNENANEKKFSLSTYLNDAKLFYIYNIGYFFNDRAFSSDVYQMNLTKPLFSANKNKVLFYARDIVTIKRNTQEAITNLNRDLNILSKELKVLGITLIVLPSPDKYDLYSDYIRDNKYQKNLFFTYLNMENKDYFYLDTKALLSEELSKGVKDIYFADDSHWSPKASKIIAEKISDIIKMNFN
ncbi:MAG TPA: hypothetical protein VIN72_06835 [Lutibacter sp.]